MSELTVIFIDAFGNNETRHMHQIPREGECVPLFHSKGRVSLVTWFPSKLDKDLFSGVDVLITLS
jgi:hypothetical protein